MTRKTGHIILTISAVLVIGFGLQQWQQEHAHASLDDEPAPKSKQLTEQRAAEDKKVAARKRLEAEIVEAVTNMVRGRLLAPRTAIFEHVYADPDKKEQKIIGSVSAQNGFGALIEATYMADVYVHENGTVSVIYPTFIKEGFAKETERIWRDDHPFGIGTGTVAGRASANLESR